MIRKHFQRQLMSQLISRIDYTGMVVITDWKMIILAIYYVKAQTQYFGVSPGHDSNMESQSDRNN
jgi:hypothetical protein